jgi:hypothetical protein
MLNEVITKAETAQATADAALPKAGGTMTGPLALTSNSSVGAGNYALLKFGGDAAADDFHIVRETSGFNLYSGVAGSGIRRFGVDASGRVTEPAQPSFSGYMTTNQTLLSDVWTKVLINTTRFNVGSHFNGTNNRFTAPVTGKYIFNYTVNFSSATGPYNYTGLQVNGAFYHYGFGLRNYDGWQGDNTLSAAQIVQLNAGDYVELHAYAAGGVLLLSGGERCSFAGYLLG